MKVKKLMYSYHVPKEYELFDKLNWNEFLNLLISKW
jgi:hypothetical protein